MEENNAGRLGERRGGRSVDDEALAGLQGRFIPGVSIWMRRPFLSKGETSLSLLSPRFARVVHSFSVAFDIDLDTSTLFQAHVDRALPLRVFGLAPEDEVCPELSPDQQKTALDLASQSAEAWFGWTLPAEGGLGSSPDPEASPPFDLD